MCALRKRCLQHLQLTMQTITPSSYPMSKDMGFFLMHSAYVSKLREMCAGFNE